jgi:asparagine synthase (glutamine-hydrolysing)
MPGIVGLITRMPRKEAERELQHMVDSLRHESFHVAGTWVDEALGVYVGWVARKNSLSDGMPLRNERGDVTLVFSGENFSPAGTAQKLKARGHELEITGPSYLVHLFEERPDAFLSELNGRFHGLLIDQRDGTATLFNDRYGMHRLYFHEAKEGFYFAAEAKAILAVRPELRSTDPRGLGEFVSCGCTLEGRTLFKGITRLPSGSKWVFQGESIQERGRYFERAEWEGQTPLEPEAFYHQVQRVFSTNISRYFAGQERIGMSLTGGLDTRIILAWHKAESGSLPCYTFGGTLRDCRDVVVARRVAGLCGQDHSVIPVTQEFLARFPEYAERTVYLTDGCIDVGLAPDLYLNERAREIAPVRMTGLYGSEVLRGVCGIKPERPLPGLFSSDVLSHSRRADEAYDRLRRGNPLSFAVFDQLPSYQYGILALEETQNSVRTPYLDNDLVQTLFRSPRLSRSARDFSLRLIGEGNRILLQIPTDRGVAGDGGRISKFVFRALLEFLFKVEYRYDIGMPHWLARVDHALSKLCLERLFLGRHKIFHFRVWYRDVLSGYVREMLLDGRTLSRPYLDRKGVEMIVSRHLKGDRNYTQEIHKVITLELLHRLFVDSGSFHNVSQAFQPALHAE